MADAIEVFVAAYDAESGARDALRDLRRMQNKGTIELIDAAIVVHRDDGTVKIEETGDPGSGTWAKRGAIAGGLVGLIFPPGIIASAVTTTTMATPQMRPYGSVELLQKSPAVIPGATFRAAAAGRAGPFRRRAAVPQAPCRLGTVGSPGAGNR